MEVIKAFLFYTWTKAEKAISDWDMMAFVLHMKILDSQQDLLAYTRFQGHCFVVRKGVFKR